MRERAENSLNQSIRDKFFYWIFAVLCFAVILASVLYFEGREKSVSPDIVVFGDSIMGRTRGADLICDRMRECSGRTIQNGAFGGTCMARKNALYYMDHRGDELCMVSLVKAVVSEDFEAQQSVYITQPATWYFEQQIDELAKIDFDRVKVVFLEFGMNDYQCGIPLEHSEDPYAEITFAGALRTVLRQLRSRYSGLRIILLTPTYSWYIDRGLTCEEFDGGGGILEDYVNCELRIAKECNVEILDLYHDFYPHELWEDHGKYTVDGVHPNEEGKEKIARTITEYLEENP